MVFIKLVVGLCVFVATWAAATYLFTKKFAGISFLNKSSIKSSNEKRSDQVTHIKSFRADSLEEILTVLQLR